ncbi:MAG TPA: VCBS repeat-containing protein [Candidatus Acidoferrum sp.]
MFRLCAKLALLLLLCSSVARAQSQNLFFVPLTFPGSGTAFTADLNNDGKAELINADGTVLLGNGDGTFKTGTPWFVSGQTPGNLVAVADFNSDGKPDLLLVNQGTAACCTVFVMLGNGDGTFQAPITTANMGTSLGSVMVADFNGDGKLDIVGIGAGGVWVFFGKGDGTFTVPGVQFALTRVNQLAIGDFNGDGKTDILVATGASDITAQGSL